MTVHESEASSGQFQNTREVLDTLRAARDTVRVQAHLLSLEAKQRWRELDDRLDGVEARLRQDGEPAEGPGEHARSKLRELARAVREFVKEGLPASTLTRPVRTIASAPFQSVGPLDSLALAAQVLWETDCGALPVIDSERRLLGILTDRDICMAAFTRGLPLHAINVADTMSRVVHSAGPNDSIGTVLQLMSRERVRRVPLLENGRLWGIVAISDIVRSVRTQGGIDASAAVAVAEALATICEPRAPLGSAANAAQ